MAEEDEEEGARGGGPRSTATGEAAQRGHMAGREWWRGEAGQRRAGTRGCCARRRRGVGTGARKLRARARVATTWAFLSGHACAFDSHRLPRALPAGSHSSYVAALGFPFSNA